MHLRLAILLLGALYIAGAAPAFASTGPFAGSGPRLVAGGDGTVILSYLQPDEAGHSLVFRSFDGRSFGPARKVASGNNWFVNWADFPSVLPAAEGDWAAHWLVRQPAGGYAYDVAISLSGDAGRSWSEPFLLHEDDTPTEHGFVTLFRTGEQLGAVWLDGRHMVGDHATQSHDGGMTLRAAVIHGTNSVSGKAEIDGLTCDCCQTDVAVTDNGPIVIYRDRTPDEIRDIYVARQVDGRWLPGRPVFDDGWNISGCPVNGPVIDRVGATLAATWFTAAGGNPKIQTAWSDDFGENFGPPVVIAEDNVVGYVGQAPTSNDSVAISWLCGEPGSPLDVCYRTARRDGHLGTVQAIGSTDVVARMSVPQVARVDDGLLLVWTARHDGEYVIEHRLVPIPSR